jgi:hypothetical protein
LGWFDFSVNPWPCSFWMDLSVEDHLWNDRVVSSEKGI